MGALPSFKTSPQVARTRPDDSAQGVPREIAISATFDMPIDPATIDGDHFLVSSQGGDRSGTIAYDPISKTATFSPEQPFAPGENVQVQLTSDIASLWGLSLSADYSWSFEITTATEVQAPDPAVLPSAFALQQNYPNPFNAATRIRFSLSATGPVGLRIYNMLGQLVKTLVDGELPAGEHQALWDGTDQGGTAVASGAYICRLEANGRDDVKRMMLVR